MSSSAVRGSPTARETQDSPFPMRTCRLPDPEALRSTHGELWRWPTEAPTLQVVNSSWFTRTQCWARTTQFVGQVTSGLDVIEYVAAKVCRIRRPIKLTEPRRSHSLSRPQP